MPKSKLTQFPPEGAAVTRALHTVAFYETDAMGIVHHSNYVRYLEHARVAFLAEHDRPYEQYVELGFHVPVTRAEVQYLRGSRFADPLTIDCWLAWARHASLGFSYRIECRGQLVALGSTDHAIIDRDSRPQRIPESMRERLGHWLGTKGD